MRVLFQDYYSGCMPEGAYMFIVLDLRYLYCVLPIGGHYMKSYALFMRYILLLLM